MPPEKLGAIERMGSGVLNKVFLEFRPEDQFWPSGPDAPEVIGTSSSQRGAFSVWINMQKITGKSILMAWTSGDAARAIEHWDDETTQRSAKQSACEIYISPNESLSVGRILASPQSLDWRSAFVLGSQVSAYNGETSAATVQPA